MPMGEEGRCGGCGAAGIMNTITAGDDPAPIAFRCSACMMKMLRALSDFATDEAGDFVRKSRPMVPPLVTLLEPEIN